MAESAGRLRQLLLCAAEARPPAPWGQSGSRHLCLGPLGVNRATASVCSKGHLEDRMGWDTAGRQNVTWSRDDDGPLLGCSIHLSKQPGWYYHTHISDGGHTHTGQTANRGHPARPGFTAPKPTLPPPPPRTVCALDHGPLRGKGPGDSTSSAWWSFIILNPLLLLRPCWLLPRVTGRKRLPYCVQLLVGSLRSADG